MISQYDHRVIFCRFIFISSVGRDFRSFQSFGKRDAYVFGILLLKGDDIAGFS